MVPIQPRDFGEMLNVWFRSLGATWKALVVGGLIIFTPATIVAVIASLALGLGDFFGTAFYDPEALEFWTEQDWIDFAWRASIMFLIWIVVLWVAAVLATLAAAQIAVRNELGQTVDWREGIRLGSKRLGSGLAYQGLVGLGFLIAMALAALVIGVLFSADLDGLAVFLGFVTFLVIVTGSIGLAFLLAAAIPAISVESLGAIDGIRRSVELVRQRFWPTAGFLLLTSIIAGAAGQVLGIVAWPFFLLGLINPTAILLGYAIVFLLSSPITMATGSAFTVWYVDLRARNEELSEENLILD